MELGGALDVIPGDAQLCVAYSGGLDSTVLLHALAHRCARRVRAVHVNHQLQARADDWERHCVEFAGMLGVPLVVVHATVQRGNLEAQARRARYHAWQEVLRTDEWLLLAHHADDQAETVLWQLVTGRAPVGMPRERPLGDGRLLRPLLNLRRVALEDYAKTHELAWVRDPSNADTSYDRNFIRLQIVPKIDARFPDAIAAIAAHAGMVVTRPSGAPLAVADLTAQALREWLGMAVSDRLVEEILRQTDARDDAAPEIALPDERSVRRYDGRIYVVEAASIERGAGDVRVGRAVAWSHGALAWRQAQRGLADGRTFTVRHRRGAERITPAGRGVSKDLKTLFQEARIPPWQRPAWPLLFDGGDLIAVPGIAVADASAVPDGWWPSWQPRIDLSFSQA